MNPTSFQFPASSGSWPQSRRLQTLFPSRLCESALQAALGMLCWEAESPDSLQELLHLNVHPLTLTLLA